MTAKKKKEEVVAAAEIAEITEGYTFVPVWEGGNGNILMRTVARNQGEAINNLCDKSPILAAIGCHAERMMDVDGCEIVAVVPEGFEYGDDRRNKAARE